ncbi:PREDICTED: TSC22 domain family protein 1-like, partial [Mesitornis unicolor]|uniref:TSC22 domain family protein 1-like n=1 Tax=Mesitornis unicolor TaxID=54374 RepID=UPI00052876B4
DLVKNHLMYAVREEVEVLKEQIKELLEKNSQLERENSLLKTLASPEQLEKFQSRHRDLVKNHLMYAVREEVEVLKEQIKELLEKNSQLERENSLLKTLASPEQLEKFQSRLTEPRGGCPGPALRGLCG